LTFERIYCVLRMGGSSPGESWHRVLVVGSVSVRVRADCLSVQVSLRVMGLQGLTSVADCSWRVGEHVGCLLMAEALFVVFVFFLDLSMLLNKHWVISLLALTERASLTEWGFITRKLIGGVLFVCVLV
jgi:hypothetical protein